MQTFHLFFRVACERFLQTCRNDGTPLKLKLLLFIDCAYPIQFCHLPLLTGSFNCKTVLIIELSILLCLKCISKICAFLLKTRFFTQIFFHLKRCPLGCEYGTENRFELRALVYTLQRFKTFVIGLKVFLMEICIM